MFVTFVYFFQELIETLVVSIISAGFYLSQWIKLDPCSFLFYISLSNIAIC